MTYVSAGRSPGDPRPDAGRAAPGVHRSGLAASPGCCSPACRRSARRVSTWRPRDGRIWPARGTRWAACSRDGGSSSARWRCRSCCSSRAGLFVRSLQNLQRQDDGTDRSQVLIVRVEPRGSDQRNVPGALARLDGIYRDLLARVERLPGVQSASLARTAPLAPIGFAGRVTGPSGSEANTRILMIYPKLLCDDGPADRSAAATSTTRTCGRARRSSRWRTRRSSVRCSRAREALGPGATVTLGRDRVEIIGVVKDSRLPDLRSAHAADASIRRSCRRRRGRGQMVLHVRAAGDDRPPDPGASRGGAGHRPRRPRSSKFTPWRRR